MQKELTSSQNQRRDAFKKDFFELLKKHNVLFEIDEDDEDFPVNFYFVAAKEEGAISRADFDLLTPQQKSDYALKGGKISDDKNYDIYLSGEELQDFVNHIPTDD